MRMSTETARIDELRELFASGEKGDTERRTELVSEFLLPAWLDLIEIQREEQIAAGRLCEAVDLEVSRFEAVVRARKRIKASLDEILDPLGSREVALDDLRGLAAEPEPSETGMTPTIQACADALLDLFERSVS